MFTVISQSSCERPHTLPAQLFHKRGMDVLSDKFTEIITVLESWDAEASHSCSQYSIWVPIL